MNMYLIFLVWWLFDFELELEFELQLELFPSLANVECTYYSLEWNFGSRNGEEMKGRSRSLNGNVSVNSSIEGNHDKTGRGLERNEFSTKPTDDYNA